MSTAQQTLRFQADAREVLDLMVHSLYKNREIFLRELISNAADALDKRRIESLQDQQLAATSAEACIRIELVARSRTLSIHDGGIGMSRTELIEHLGTIARSGTRAFAQKLRESGTSSAPELIGQFGVGFYSCFLVADRVEVVSRRAGADEAWRWSSDGQGEFQIEPAERAEAGTSIHLHLRQPRDEEETGEAEPDWLDPLVLKEVIHRWSDFVAWPILIDGEQVNSTKPLWTRSREDIKPEEYHEFYRQLTHDHRDPLWTLHLKVEGTSEYTALLYVPAEKPLDPLELARGQSRLSLYVKRVLIVPEAGELLPDWLRFVRGLVDANDLPLNVSREVLQANPAVRAIRRRLTRRLCDDFARLLKEDRSRYTQLFERFGSNLKEGIYAGDDEAGQLQKLLLFETTHSEERCTLAEYCARMPAEQQQIPYLIGPDRTTLLGSAHLELFQKKGQEVLLLTDSIDEWMLARMPAYEGKALVPADRAANDLLSASEREACEAQDREQRSLLTAIETQLSNEVATARFSARLCDSPAALTNAPGGITPQMERMLRAAGSQVPAQRRVLELNPDHALVRQLIASHQADPSGQASREWIEFLYGQAQLAEGSPLENPGRFAKLVARLLSASPEKQT